MKSTIYNTLFILAVQALVAQKLPQKFIGKWVSNGVKCNSDQAINIYDNAMDIYSVSPHYPSNESFTAVRQINENEYEVTMLPISSDNTQFAKKIKLTFKYNFLVIEERDFNYDTYEAKIDETLYETYPIKTLTRCKE